MNRKAPPLLWAAVVAGATAALVVTFTRHTSMAEEKKPTPPQLPVEGSLPSLGGATEWLNSPPLSPGSLRGKVVLVEFWTYTCINWLRTLAYVRAWSEKYKDRGVVVIGVHSPEFSFERDLDNVRRATKEMKIPYPVAVDSDFAIWRAFRNAYWPALYVIDAEGRIRYHWFGEGRYDDTEKAIQRLLEEAGATGIGHELATVDARGVEAQADWADLQTGETYLGRERAENFDASAGALADGRHTYAAPARLRNSHWAISGDWTVGKEAILLNQAHGRIAYRFHARDLHLILGPAKGRTPIHFRVLIDGQPAAGARGVDVDEQGNGTVTEQRMYQLIRQPKPIADRLFEIEFFDAGVEAFAFTFG